MIELMDRPPDVWETNKIIGWLNDPVLMKYSEQRRQVHTPKTQHDYVAIARRLPSQYRLAYHDKELIGTATANLDDHNSIADVGILIGSEHGEKGYGREVWRIFCGILAKEYSVRKIEGGCMAQNKAMIRVFEKNQMRLEGTRRYHFWTGKNEYDDMVLYGRLT